MSTAYAQRLVSCPTPIGRFMRRVNKTEACWEWTGGLSDTGYGQFTPKGNEKVSAHRWMFMLLCGPIPSGLQLDHLCRNRRCVNPDHLERVSLKENIQRGMAPSAIGKRTGLCIRGHALEPDTAPSMQGRQTCRTCKRERSRLYRLRVAKAEEA